MTEQLSAEAINVAKAHSRDEWGDDHGGWYTLAQAIEALIARRVSAETERWQNRDRQRMAQISTLQETVQSFQSARAERPAPNRHWHEGPPYCERPAPEGPQQGGYVIEVEFDDGDEAQRAYDAIETMLGEMGQLGTLGMRPLPSALASTGELASEREAAAIRAFGKRVWSDSEEVAYQAGVSDTRERLREPEVREAIIALLTPSLHRWIDPGEATDYAIAKIAEMLK
jgi:hypothetical protein